MDSGELSVESTFNNSSSGSGCGLTLTSSSSSPFKMLASSASSTSTAGHYPSTSPYLNPDYVQPLCTSLDAKNSPLALLAQTCSSIGRDTNSSTSTAPKSNSLTDAKKDSSAHHQRPGSTTISQLGRSSPAGGHKSAKKPLTSGTGTSRLSDDLSTSPQSRGAAVTSRRTPGLHSSRRSDDSSSVSPRDRASSGSGDRRHQGPAGPFPAQSSTSDGGLRYAEHGQDRLSNNNNNAGSPGGSAGTGDACLKSPLSGLPSPAAVALQQLRLQQEAAALQAAALAAAAYSPLLYPPPPTPGASAGMDPLSVYSAGLQAAAAALYPRLKDPMCAQDQCTIPGCTQCRSNGRDPLRHAPFPSSLYQGLFGNGTTSAASAFPSLGRPSTGSGSYACSWLLPGGDFCGKRFPSSDELHQHLRSHVVEAASYSTTSPPTSSASSELSLAQHLLQPQFGFPGTCAPPPFPSSFFDAARLSSLGPHFPGSLSPSSLLAFHQQQSRGGGSVSPTSAAASFLRYHPYKTPGLQLASSSAYGGVPSSAAGPGLPVGPSPSALAAYFSSPYAALFGSPQMGAAAGP